MRLLVVLVLLAAAVSTARADAFRCGERLVNLGDRIGEVTLKCGPPTFAEQRQETRGSDTVTIETWTYNLGPRDFVRTLTFVGGSLTKIKAGDYGK